MPAYIHAISIKELILVLCSLIMVLLPYVGYGIKSSSNCGHSDNYSVTTDFPRRRGSYDRIDSH
jgi:hypothetical protein